MAGYLHRTAQPPILAVFLPWGGSAGAGRVRPAVANVGQIEGFSKGLIGKKAHYQLCLELTVTKPIIWSCLALGDL